MTDLITGVTLGVTESFGTASVANAAQSFTPLSLAPAIPPLPVVHRGESGANIELDLTGSYTPPAGSALSLPLSGAPLVLGALGDNSAFGTASVANSAQDFSPEGFETPVFGRGTRVNFTADDYSITLDLTGSYTPGTAANVPLNWGGASVTAGVGVPGESVVGTPTVETTAQLFSQGWDSLAVSTNARLGSGQSGAAVTLDLTQPQGTGARLDFSLNRPFVPTGFLAEVFGATTVANAAQDFAPVGIAPPVIGKPFALFPSGWYPLNLNMVGAYTSPNAAAVQMNWGSTTKAVRPQSVQLGAEFGASSVQNVADGLFAIGFDAPRYGYPTIAENGVLFAFGIAPAPQTGPNSDRGIPSPEIELADRELAPDGIEPTSDTWPVHYIAHELQYLPIQNDGIAPGDAGSHVIDFAERMITVPFITSMVFGDHGVIRDLNLYSVGWESSVIPTLHEFLVNTRRVTAVGIPPGGVGAGHSIRLEFRVLGPDAILPQQVAVPNVYNQDRYLGVQPYQDTNSDPALYGAAGVVNVDRSVSTFGHQSSRFGLSTWVYNNADPILPGGLDATLWGDDTFIAYEHRSVPIGGYEFTFFGGYAIVYNDARVISASALEVTTAVGRPDPVLNLDRTVKQHSGHVGAEHGTPFVAHAIRYLYPSVLKVPAAAIPEIRHNPHPISPVGFVAEIPPGIREIFERFAIARPPSVNVYQTPPFGEASVVNRNRSFTPYSYDHSEFGRPVSHLYIRNVYPIGVRFTQLGLYAISYRTKTIVQQPVSLPSFPVTHRIRNELPDPPYTRSLYPTSAFAGTQSNPGEYGTLEIRTATLFPLGFLDSFIGAHDVRGTGITPLGIVDLDQLGTPTVLGPQSIFVPSIPNLEGLGESDTFETLPRFSPHHIYAPRGEEAPPGYQGGGELVDKDLLEFGTHAVTNQNRAIYPTWFVQTLGWSSRVGAPEAQLKIRRVYPSTIRSLRMGLPILPFTDRFISLDTSNYGIAIPDPRFGAHEIAPPPEEVVPFADPSGWLSQAIGQHEVELFNRQVYPSGFQADVWGDALVGYPREYVIGAGDQTLWGTHRVEHYIRYLLSLGWISSTLEDEDIIWFNDRMKVNIRNPQGGLQGVEPGLAFGQAVIEYVDRTIPGRSIVGYAAGVPEVRAVLTIALIGWDSSVFGDIDEWEAEKIKVHGDDLSRVAIPRITHPVVPASIASGVIADPRMARPIYASGMPEVGFDGPVVSNPLGCTNRFVVPLPIAPQAVGTADVVETAYRSLLPLSIDDEAYGIPVTIHVVAPLGVDESAYGTAFVTLSIEAVSIADEVFGTASVAPVLKPSSIDDGVIGSHSIAIPEPYQVLIDETTGKVMITESGKVLIKI